MLLSSKRGVGLSEFYLFQKNDKYTFNLLLAVGRSDWK